jgi:hypothetical protein
VVTGGGGLAPPPPPPQLGAPDGCASPDGPHSGYRAGSGFAQGLGQFSLLIGVILLNSLVPQRIRCGTVLKSSAAC